MDRLARSAYSVMVNSSSLRANSVPIRAIALSSASSACFVFIVGVRVQLIDVVARLQDQLGNLQPLLKLSKAHNGLVFL